MASATSRISVQDKETRHDITGSLKMAKIDLTEFIGMERPNVPSKFDDDRVDRLSKEMRQQGEAEQQKYAQSSKSKSAGPDPNQTTTNPETLLEAYLVTDDYVQKLGNEEFLFENLIIKSHVITIIAMPGGGKTTLLYYHVAPHLAKLGLKVWYIDADSPASDHKQMKEVADKYGFMLLNPDVNPGTTMEGLLETLKVIADSHANLAGWVLIIDTLKKATNLMAKASVKEFYVLVRKIANLGGTVVLLGHANKHRDNDGNLVFEGVGDVRADSDELIYLERTSNPNGGIDVTTVVNPDKGAKVRGVFKPMSFHVSEAREVTFYDKPLETIDREATAAPKATDDEILKAAKKYLSLIRKPVLQGKMVEYVADLTGAGKGRVRKLIVQNAEPRDATHRSGKMFVYTLGKRNAHLIELPEES
ncbi:AAA family ATPase [Desulfosediminicola ganghwensis]|uniref:AAA family ATPase n=1 Tax=Desulfosediminicola ganghwensis TaxID=2569540 RepID=UPI0010AC1BFA|nr:AAA family ATPase [Desulfosediminicola ganghwensis]